MCVRTRLDQRTRRQREDPSTRRPALTLILCAVTTSVKIHVFHRGHSLPLTENRVAMDGRMPLNRAPTNSNDDTGERGEGSPSMPWQSLPLGGDGARGGK